jgi:nucleoid DNA-binding protein
MNLREWVKATHRVLASQPAENRQKDFLIAEVDMILRQSISVLIESLQTGDDLRLDDLGRLWVEQRDPRKVANNLKGQGKSHRLARRSVVRFRASTRLLTHLNQNKSGVASAQQDKRTG